MNRQERRRAGILKKDPVRMIKQSELDRMRREAVAKEAAKLAKAAKEEAVRDLFRQLLAIPVMVLHDHFGEFMKKDGREERFAERCLDLFDTVEQGYVTPQELEKCLYEEAGMRIRSHPESKERDVKSWFNAKG